jgi:hypothetical protein
MIAASSVASKIKVRIEVDEGKIGERKVLINIKGSSASIRPIIKEKICG